MRQHVVVAAKGFPAVLKQTLEGFLACVDALVPDEMATAGKALVAIAEATDILFRFVAVIHNLVRQLNAG